jgi:hypothetical protein
MLWVIAAVYLNRGVRDLGEFGSERSLNLGRSCAWNKSLIVPNAFNLIFFIRLGLALLLDHRGMSFFKRPTKTFGSLATSHLK